MILLDQLVHDFAAGMAAVDALRPQAESARSERAYQPGIGPHSESATVEMVMQRLGADASLPYADSFKLEVPYPSSPRSKCDLCLGHAPDWEWAVEFKMLRLMGDNGKPNDNILMHILSPYPKHRSALTDCEKLLDSGLRGRKAIVVFGYEYPEWPMEPAIRALEHLARRSVELGPRCQAEG